MKEQKAFRLTLESVKILVALADCRGTTQTQIVEEALALMAADVAQKEIFYLKSGVIQKQWRYTHSTAREMPLKPLKNELISTNIQAKPEEAREGEENGNR